MADIKDVAALTVAIYGEARGESRKGKEAVAHTIVNRAEIGDVPVADVVYGSATPNYGQFSFANPGDPNARTVQNAPRTDPQGWANALSIAQSVLDGRATGTLADPTRGATHYHASSVNPSWGRAFDKTARIGAHQFYRAPASEVRAIVRASAFSPHRRPDLVPPAAVKGARTVALPDKVAVPSSRPVSLPQTAPIPTARPFAPSPMAPKGDRLTPADARVARAHAPPMPGLGGFRGLPQTAPIPTAAPRGLLANIPTPTSAPPTPTPAPRGLAAAAAAAAATEHAKPSLSRFGYELAPAPAPAQTGGWMSAHAAPAPAAADYALGLGSESRAMPSASRFGHDMEAHVASPLHAPVPTPAPRGAAATPTPAPAPRDETVKEQTIAAPAAQRGFSMPSLPSLPNPLAGANLGQRAGMAAMGFGLAGIPGALVGGLLGPAIAQGLGGLMGGRQVTSPQGISYTQGLPFPNAPMPVPGGLGSFGSNLSHGEMAAISPAAAGAIGRGQAGLY
jgi:hypothetical protein